MKTFVHALLVCFALAISSFSFAQDYDYQDDPVTSLFQNYNDGYGYHSELCAPRFGHCRGGQVRCCGGLSCIYVDGGKDYCDYEPYSPPQYCAGYGERCRGGNIPCCYPLRCHFVDGGKDRCF